MVTVGRPAFVGLGGADRAGIGNWPTIFPRDPATAEVRDMVFESAMACANDSGHPMRFILTGTPGSGKTAVLRQLEVDGFGVVEEAATDVIALSQARGVDEPWQRHGFTEAIASLQRRRQRAAGHHEGPVFFDRSPVCTYALALYLGHPVGDLLAGELDRIRDERIYDKRVFFIASQGFVTPTPARRISLPEAQRFEELHAEVYRSLGYELIAIAPGPLDVRVAAVLAQASAV